jgi:ACS family hexuronate transporter-like MFS transporter
VSSTNQPNPDHLDVNLPAEQVRSQSPEMQDQSEAATAIGATVAAVEYATPMVSVMSRYRWVICAMLFFATTINYMDRMVLGILAPTLQTEIGWTNTQYGEINSAFNAAYAIGLLVMGWVMDRIGTRIGFAISIAFWSVAAMAHALARTVFGFASARFFLALGEGGNFPASIKTVAEWFPKKERALATGIFNAGANVGAVVAPLVVPFIVLHLHWQWAFIFTGSIGFIWMFAWISIYRRPEEHPKVSAGELAYIRSDPVDPPVKVPYLKLVPHRQTWAFAVGKFLTDPVWWVIGTFWAAKYLADTYQLKLSGLALPLVVIYVAADFGSIIGGWISSRLLKSGWSTNAARKTAMFLCGACVMSLLAAPHVHHLWWTVGLLSIAAGAHQGWSANLFTLVSDTFPRFAVGSVVGFGGFFGAIGGVIANYATGVAIDATHSYNGVLYTAAGMYLFTLLLIHLLVPRLEPAQIKDDRHGFEPVVS